MNNNNEKLEEIKKNQIKNKYFETQGSLIEFLSNFDILEIVKNILGN